ncbi:MAG TPA: FAD-binding protein [Desulfobacteraceae bacterium]|nr:FAD-binding protein [Desulfobacteraceae bacterium]
MLNKRISKEFKKIIGDRWLLESRVDLLSYSYDGYIFEFLPDAVVVPEDAHQISEILRIANSEGISVVPRGAGTNISGCAVARKGGIILAFHRMNKIIEIDRENRCAVVEPGVINAELQKMVEGFGLMYPPDPASMFVSTLGGNVALNAGGPRGVKYGVTKDYLMGLELVLPNGKVIMCGGKTFKNVSGYDLKSLICGSEGTLGIITKIILKLIPLPHSRATLQAIYDDVEKASKTVSSIIAERIVPVTLELMDRVVLQQIQGYGGAQFPVGADALLLIEVDGEGELVKTQAEKIKKFCLKMGAMEVEKAEDRDGIERLWQARRTAFAAVARLRPNIIVEDATVPVAHIPQMVNKIKEISKKYLLKIGVLAHAGDGNLHPLIMTDIRDKEEMRRVEDAMNELFDETISLGGTLTGEHGIGISKKGFIYKEFKEEHIELMRGIKRVFDPKNILNPGGYLES